VGHPCSLLNTCEGWVARDVVRHLVEWISAFLTDAGGPQLRTGPSPDIDPVEAWTTLDCGLQELLDDPATCSTEIIHPRVGRYRVGDAVATFFISDILVHTWDLARATGLDETLDPETVHLTLLGMEPLDSVLRASGQYAPRIDVPPGADEQTQLIAFTGRTP
jgi:uncharacterized protein (TIGR03086 family)